LSEELVPDLVEFRTFVDTRVPKKRDEILIKVLYLCAARVSEVITRTTESEFAKNLTKPYGQYLTVDVVRNYRVNPAMLTEKPKEVAVIKLQVAKRRLNPAKKSIALPINLEYEPWIYDILKWALEHQKVLSFPLNRFTVWRIVNKNLKPILDPMRKALRESTDKEKILNPWRHWRLTHLADIYGFDSTDLTLVAGWTFKTGLRMGSPVDAYLHMDWRHYLPKLLVPCLYQKAKKEVAA